MNLLVIFLSLSLLAKIDKIKTFYGEFIQITNVDTTIGRIYFKRPDKMRIELVYPETVLIIWNAGKLVQVTKEDTEVSEVEGSNNPLEFFLNINQYEVKKVNKNWYRVKLSEDMDVLMQIIEQKPIPLIRSIKFGEFIMRFKNVKYNEKQDIKIYKWNY